MKPTLRMLLPLLLALPVLPGCKSNYLILSTYTKVGLEVSTSDGKPTQAVFGYKRFEGASIPVDPDGDGEEKEAMSTFVAMEVDNSWLSGLELHQVFATGPAAVNAVQKTRTMANLLTRGKKQEEAE